MQVALNAAVFARVKRAIEQTTYIKEWVVIPETRLTFDLALGKLARLKLAMNLEEAFDLEFSDEVLKQFSTVAEIVKYIGEHYFRDIESSWLAEAA